MVKGEDFELTSSRDKGHPVYISYPVGSHQAAPSTMYPMNKVIPRLDLLYVTSRFGEGGGQGSPKHGS